MYTHIYTYMHTYINTSIHLYIYTQAGDRAPEAGVRPPQAGHQPPETGDQGFQGHASSILRIRNLVPRMVVLYCFLFGDSSNRGMSKQ